MSASLISPSGKVLVRRARCSLQPGPDPLAMPVLVNGGAEPDAPPRPLADGDARDAEPDPPAETTLAR